MFSCPSLKCFLLYNVLVDIVDVDGMWEPRIKIAGFGNSQIDLHHINASHGLVFRAPEILDGLRPYDGEKADVFASAFILLAIFAVDNFSSNGREQVRSDAYEYFKENGHLTPFWKAKRLTPSLELQELFAGMVQEDPRDRWTVEKIINCAWMTNQDVPDPREVSNEAIRVIEFLNEQLVRLSITEPIGEQVGYSLHVKGNKGIQSKGNDYDKETLATIEAYEKAFREEVIKPEAFAAFISEDDNSARVRKRLHIIEKLKDNKNSNIKVYICKRESQFPVSSDNFQDHMKQYLMIKENKNIEGRAKMINEYNNIHEIGQDANIIEINFQHYTDEAFVQQAYFLPNAKDLFNFLMTMNEYFQVRGQEEWSRYLFLQFIAGLKKIHEKNIAHLDINTGNLLVDIDANWQPKIMIGGFELSQVDHKKVTKPYGRSNSAPELSRDYQAPYDGEKADVFASALILLAIYANDNFCNRGCYENRYSPYEYFVEKRNLRRYWEELGLSPTQELQNMLYGMLHEDPDKRTSINDILDSKWMKEGVSELSMQTITYQTMVVVEQKFQKQYDTFYKKIKPTKFYQSADDTYYKLPSSDLWEEAEYLADTLKKEKRSPRPYDLRHTFDWTQITFEKGDPLVLFAYLTLVIGYMEDDYDKITISSQEEGPQEILSEIVIIEMQDQDTMKYLVHLAFKVELFVMPENVGQAVLLFFLEQGDGYDLKIFLDQFKQRISKSFEKINLKKLHEKV